MTLLLIGGTADARQLANELFKNNVSVIYSVAGLVRKPDVPCEIVSGGFSQFATSSARQGLENYIKDKGISAILDATHPFAQKMSTTAVKSANNCNIPCWRFHRPEWKKQENDDWLSFDSLEQLLPHLKDKKNVFFSVGQIRQEFIEQLDILLEGQVQRQIIRTAGKPRIKLKPSMHWIKAIGPFKFEDEMAILKQFEIDVVVTKNSGGDATIAKLDAARKAKIPVFMLKRPGLPAAKKVFSEPLVCMEFVIKHYNKQNDDL